MTNRADEKIKAKINKLLALSASDNENESRIAMRQAMALMRKHSLCENELNVAEIKTITYVANYRQLPMWCRMLVGRISKALGVFVVYVASANTASGNIEMYFTGADGAPERAEFVFITASRIIEQLATNWRKSQVLKPSRAECNDYRQGLAMAYAKRVKEVYGEIEKEMACEPGTALIPIDTRLANAEDFYRNNLEEGGVISSQTSKYRGSSALYDGISDGQHVSVSQGVKGNTRKTLALS